MVRIAIVILDIKFATFDRPSASIDLNYAKNPTRELNFNRAKESTGGINCFCRETIRFHFAIAATRHL